MAAAIKSLVDSDKRTPALDLAQFLGAPQRV
jgi:hypothetical protein